MLQSPVPVPPTHEVTQASTTILVFLDAAWLLRGATGPALRGGHRLGPELGADQNFWTQRDPSLVVRRTIFFLRICQKGLMPTVRSILPDRLKRARLATIAKDPSYRRYFAAGDDSASIRTVLAHLYEAGGNARKLRDLERQARSRRSHNAAARRRQTQQHVTPERDLRQEMVARERRKATLGIRATASLAGRV